mmetsp:Transcript_74500/g.206945  ORF Transcript_74500/g.206945 Transcript_74500/m.206945 type:complete len:217 (+) Transcript_74500:937-1587(+)
MFLSKFCNAPTHKQNSMHWSCVPWANRMPNQCVLMNAMRCRMIWSLSEPSGNNLLIRLSASTLASNAGMALSGLAQRLHTPFKPSGTRRHRMGTDSMTKLPLLFRTLAIKSCAVVSCADTSEIACGILGEVGSTCLCGDKRGEPDFEVPLESPVFKRFNSLDRCDWLLTECSVFEREDLRSDSDAVSLMLSVDSDTQMDSMAWPESPRSTYGTLDE